MKKKTREEKQCPKLELKKFSADDLADAFYDGKCIAVLVNNDGGPRCADWRSPKLKELERFGTRLRAAIPIRGLCVSFGDYTESSDGSRLNEGFHIEEGRPNGIVGFTMIGFLGAWSQYYEVADTADRHEVSEAFLTHYNDRMDHAIKCNDKKFHAATEQMGKYVSSTSMDQQAHVFLSRDVVIMSYLAACRGVADFSLDEWPQYLDSVVIFYDRASKMITDMGLLPRSAVESI